MLISHDMTTEQFTELKTSIEKHTLEHAADRGTDCVIVHAMLEYRASGRVVIILRSITHSDYGLLDSRFFDPFMTSYSTPEDAIAAANRQ